MNLSVASAAGLRSGEDSWFNKYEEVKELAADILAQIQVSQVEQANVKFHL